MGVLGTPAPAAAASPVGRLPAHVAVVALLAFVLLVVATPREAYWAFAVHAALLAAVVRLARVPLRYLLPRMLVETPFLVFALVLPLVATGPRVGVAGLSLSQEGLLGAWNVVAKGTLGVVAAIVLGATTQPRDLVAGLQRLRVPATLVEIAAFMLRYLEVVADDMRRMRIARESRGFEARHLGHLAVVARSAGALFVRTYERGERVHLAMLSRGYAGALPVLDERPVPGRTWAAAAAVPLVALGTAVTAAVTT